MTVRVISGDCREVLAKLEPESVHCVVTSPPYYGLRDYGIAGQIGLEATPEAYIDTLVGIFREARRVLRNDGTLWVNIGDSYNNFRSQMGGGQTLHGGELRGKISPNSRRRGWAKIKEKDLIGIPWMLAFALRADGWWLRRDIIWSKPNPMPESVTDRCTTAHEYLFHLAKSASYYFDADAIAEPFATELNAQSRGPKDTPMERWPRDGGNGGLHGMAIKMRSGGATFRNKRSVWTIPTAPFPEAHFATFPPALVEPCLLAGCPEGGVALDPFGGSGTVGLVADRLGRDAILIELNPTYADMARRRIRDDAPLLTTVAAD